MDKAGSGAATFLDAIAGHDPRNLADGFRADAGRFFGDAVDAVVGSMVTAVNDDGIFEEAFVLEVFDHLAHGPVALRDAGEVAAPDALQRRLEILWFEEPIGLLQFFHLRPEVPEDAR